MKKEKQKTIKDHKNAGVQSISPVRRRLLCTVKTKVSDITG